MKRPEPLRFLRAYAPVLLSAALMALSRRYPWLGFLAFAGLVPLFVFFDRNAVSRERSPIIAGFLYMAAYVPIALYWIAMTAQYATITTGPWIRYSLTAGILLGVVVVLGVSHAAFFWALQRVWRRFPRIAGLSAGVFWAALEWSLNHGEFRFPWLNLGYSLADYRVLIQPADLGGVYMLSLLIVAVNFLLFRIRSHPRRNGAILAGLLVIWTGYGLLRLQTVRPVPGDVRVGLVQPSVPQDQKWDLAFYQETLNRIYTTTDSLVVRGVDLAVWPESSMPVPLLRYEPGRKFVTGLAGHLNIDIFSGFEHYLDRKPHPSAEATFFNAATVFHPDGSNEDPYYKMALVPFGERMPLLKVFPFLWNISLGQANFEPGTTRRYYRLKSLQYTPLICFEVAFPELVAAGERADFFVNITNDAWYKHSVGTRQHAELARFRSVETRRTILRATNTGYTLYTDPTGSEFMRTRLFERTGIIVRVPLWHGSSLYATHFRHFGFGLTILALFLLVSSVVFKREGIRK